MNKLLITTLCAGVIAFASSSYAVPINVLPGGDFPANDISDVTGNPGLGDQNVLDWLQAVASDNGFPAPTENISDYTGGAIAAGDFLVLHYGAGSDGTHGTGGGLVAIYFDADAASFAVPANGSGPNGTGGLSFSRLFDHVPGGNDVPDGGATAMLLGVGLAGTGWLSRKFKR